MIILGYIFMTIMSDRAKEGVIMKNLRVASPAVLALLALLITACTASIPDTSSTVTNSGSGSGGSASSGSGGEGAGSSPETTPAQVQTVAWQSDGAGFTEFFTNDSSYIHSSAWSEWTWGTTSLQPTTSVETEVRKLGGDSSMGCGIVFSLQDQNDFLAVYIDINGYYSIGKVVGGTYSSIVGWTDANASSTVLYEGYGVTNDILVSYTSATKRYAVSFNGVAVTSFTDATFSGGYFGYVVGISASESFPTAPVDVRFKQIQPAP